MGESATRRLGRRFRFSIRQILLVIAALAMLLAPLALYLRHEARTRQMFQALNVKLALARDQTAVMITVNDLLEGRLSRLAGASADGAPEPWKAELDRLRRENEGLRARIQELETSPRR